VTQAACSHEHKLIFLATKKTAGEDPGVAVGFFLRLTRSPTVIETGGTSVQLSGGWNGISPGKEKLTPLIQPPIGSSVPESASAGRARYAKSTTKKPMIAQGSPPCFR